MKVVGKINNQKVVVLLDTGATHNFLNSRLAHLVEGKVTPQASFNIMVGNGKKLSCNEICKNVSLEMHKTPFKVDLYLLPIGGVDVVEATAGAGEMLREVNFSIPSLVFSGEGGLLHCEVNSSTKAKNELEQSGERVAIPREAKGASRVEDLGGLDLGDLDHLV
ncbi:hypothetical protein EJ110_NYTH33280 [Nymphaea thermarum]|nr:hypothetical protein EJ110_NYTH33280 [Nymphaea thermarum]